MKTAVVTLTDASYYHKARRTIIDIRTKGEWTGDIVLITVGFNAPVNFLDYYNVIPFYVEHIDTTYLIEQYKRYPLHPTCDNRQYAKLTQWDKFYVFHEYFQHWERIIYFDAGMRICDRIEYIASLDCKDTILAPDDAPAYDEYKRFGGIIQLDTNPDAAQRFIENYGAATLQKRYFLNCLWVYDTALLCSITFKELVDAMNAYPICRCNEMTIMNMVFSFTHNKWKPFPEYITDIYGRNKRLFGWTEHDRDYGMHTTWRDFCFLKYPVTINFDCD
jgi:hypothetical protein